MPTEPASIGDFTDSFLEYLPDDLWAESVHGGEDEGCWIEVTVEGRRWRLFPEPTWSEADHAADVGY